MKKWVPLLLITISSVITTLVMVPSAEAGYNACDVPNFKADVPGKGGVELCGIGYPCGVEDGVCPQNFSRGQDEMSKDFYTEPIVKLADPDTKHGVTTVAENSVVAYQDGNAACKRLGGTCSGMLNSTTKNGPYTSAIPSLATCSDGPTDLPDNQYFKADCTGVPKVAGCENCPDPDCMSKVTGFASSVANESLDNVTVQFSNINNDVRSQAVTNESGEFTVDANSGYFNVTCGKTLFNESRRTTYLQPGQETVSCPSLTAAACTSNCTAPDAFGQNVCVSDCNGENGCSMNATYQRLCNQLPPDTERVVSRKNKTHVKVANCCSGPMEFRYAPEENITANSTGIGQFEITDFQRELDGTLVTVKIIRYTD